MNADVVYCIVGERATSLTTAEDMPEFACWHAEADTSILTTYSELRSRGHTLPVVIDKEDTNNYI